MKSLIDWMQHTYDELKDEDEIAIIEKYGNRTKRYTIGFTGKGDPFTSTILLESTYSVQDVLRQASWSYIRKH